MEARLSPQHYRLLALVCGYDHTTWKNRLMVHVAVYADESYFDDGYILLGGYVESVDESIKIVTPWNAILAEHPAVPYFSNHGFKSEKWCKQNGVATSDMPLLLEKRAKLAHLIADSGVLFAAYTRMWRSHFEEEILNRLRARKNPSYALIRDPYYFCYIRLIALLFYHLPRINDVLPEHERLSPLDVFVDDNGKIAKKASELFQDIKEVAEPERRSLMGTAAALDDTKTVPLQCADLYVAQLREYYSTDVMTDALQILTAQPLHPPFFAVGLDWTRAKLKAFADGLAGLPENHWLK